ncbi:MAG: 7-cyano-7-deazaguanine synthase QueC [Bdellovibrionales bacterium]
MKTLLVCSGGLDSVTLAHHIAKHHTLSGLISFNYGQRHKKELHFAKCCADRLGVAHDVVDISHFGALLGGSALTDQNNAVPDGHYQEDTMKITIVPNRNAIMLTIAYGVATARGLDAVATAVHGGDHFIYPDCRPPFINAFAAMQNHALQGVADISLYTPYLDKTKGDIAAEAEALGVPIGETWSCYKGGEIHCGRCGTCVERREALHLAGVNDPTPYTDDTFWQEAVERHRQKQMTKEKG